MEKILDKAQRSPHGLRFARQHAPEVFASLLPVTDRRYSHLPLHEEEWGNPEGWMHKVEWVQKHLGDPAHKRLMLSHHKHPHVGDYLIDRTANGAGQFPGTHIHFGMPAFASWEQVLYYLLEHPTLCHPRRSERGRHLPLSSA